MYWGVNVNRRSVAVIAWQVDVVTPTMAKEPVGLGVMAGLTVIVNLVLTDKPPGSVAVRVTANGDPKLVVGVPLMVADA